jgi:hypothetical protein
MLAVHAPEISAASAGTVSSASSAAIRKNLLRTIVHLGYPV